MESAKQIVNNPFNRITKLEFQQIVGNSEKIMAGDIPTKKLINAVNSYASPIAPEQILCLVDATRFGSAKEGMVFTEYGFFWRSAGGRNIGAMAYDDVKSIDGFVNSNKARRFTINGRFLVDVSKVDSKTFEKLKRLMLHIADGCPELQPGHWELDSLPEPDNEQNLQENNFEEKEFDDRTRNDMIGNFFIDLNPISFKEGGVLNGKVAIFQLVAALLVFAPLGYFALAINRGLGILIISSWFIISSNICSKRMRDIVGVDGLPMRLAGFFFAIGLCVPVVNIICVSYLFLKFGHYTTKRQLEANS